MSMRQSSESIMLVVHPKQIAEGKSRNEIRLTINMDDDVLHWYDEGENIWWHRLSRLCWNFRKSRALKSYFIGLNLSDLYGRFVQNTVCQKVCVVLCDWRRKKMSTSFSRYSWKYGSNLFHLQALCWRRTITLENKSIWKAGGQAVSMAKDWSKEPAELTESNPRFAFSSI